ncbi:MAG TPA: type II toxin-antitoxin system VapC family toxin [Hanamia sp.]|nr:type II toxin-antitoxin system VapC family toxin [Hanamia sp.]
MGRKISFKIEVMNYLLDTNFVINYFKGIFSDDAAKFTDSVINDLTYVSVITRMELLSWQSLKPKDEEVIKEFIFDSTVFSLEENIITKTILLRRTNKIKLPDAIIAATAIVHNLQLITHNLKDFKNIPELIVVDANAL